MPDASNFKKDYAKLESHIADLGGAESKVGWFEGSVYPDGTPVAYAAAINEFGTSKIPPRLGMRATGIEKQNAWAATAGEAAKRVLAGKMTAYDAFNLLGLQAEGDFVDHIRSVRSPALSEITLGVRKYKMEGKVVTGRTIGEIAGKLKDGKLDISGVPDQPLNFTGHMIATLTHITTESKS